MIKKTLSKSKILPFVHFTKDRSKKFLKKYCKYIKFPRVKSRLMLQMNVEEFYGKL